MQETSSPKSAFLGLMSHEIRSTLNKITGINNLVLETALNTEQRGYIETIQSSSETLLSLMNDLIDFSLIESGEFKLDEIEFDLRTAVDEAMELVAYQAVEKGIDIHTLIHASVPEMVKGDPARIRQIIVILAGNAVNVSSSGEVVLTVKTISEESDRVVVRFNITEFGCGADDNQIQLLFQPFSQPDGISSWKYGRTGLELALSKRFAQLMGGNIGLSSITGKGATFWFSVELIKCPLTIQTFSAPVQSLTGMNILIADPSASGRRIMAHYLESMGCCCREYEHSDGIAAEMTNAKDAAATYDAMIIAMQQVGGAEYEALVRMRSDETIRSIPLVLVTAIGKRGDAQKLKEAAVAAYLTRPLKQYQLIECMRMIRSRVTAGTGMIAPTAPKLRQLITRHTIAEESIVQKIRILVAEDNAFNRKAIKKFLDRAGYVCDIAENGVDALDSFGKKEYHLIIMDCHMPIMNGYDATYAIRKAEAQHPGAHIPICAMIAAASGSEKKKCFEAGMDDVIMKPLNRADFIAMVEKWERNVSASKQRITDKPKDDAVATA